MLVQFIGCLFWLSDRPFVQTVTFIGLYSLFDSFNLFSWKKFHILKILRIWTSFFITAALFFLLERFFRLASLVVVDVNNLKKAWSQWSYRRKVQQDALGKVNRVKENRIRRKDGLKINRQQSFVRKKVSRDVSVRWRGGLGSKFGTEEGKE